jgi:hypothetical protein
MKPTIGPPIATPKIAPPNIVPTFATWRRLSI